MLFEKQNVIIQKRKEGVVMFSQVLRHCLVDRNMKISDLARLLDTSHQNINQKIKRDNFSEKEMRKIADALGLDLEIVMKEKK